VLGNQCKLLLHRLPRLGPQAPEKTRGRRKIRGAGGMNSNEGGIRQDETTRRSFEGGAIRLPPSRDGVFGCTTLLAEGRGRSLLHLRGRLQSLPHDVLPARDRHGELFTEPTELLPVFLSAAARVVPGTNPGAPFWGAGLTTKCIRGVRL
jgi:hypothetical protein